MPRPEILVVDDDPDIRQALRVGLEHEGYRVATASNGREAIDWLHLHTPSLVLLDLMMPIMSGWELAELMRAAGGRLASIPICVVSGADGAPPRRAVAALRKPFALDDLLRVIKSRC